LIRNGGIETGLIENIVRVSTENRVSTTHLPDLRGTVRHGGEGDARGGGFPLYEMDTMGSNHNSRGAKSVYLSSDEEKGHSTERRAIQCPCFTPSIVHGKKRKCSFELSKIRGVIVGRSRKNPVV